MTIPEKRVAIIFSLTALSWMFRDLIQLIPFLNNLTDHVIAMISAITLFLVSDGSKDGKLMDWENAQKVPWNLLILFGGGLSLANAVASTGLAAWLGNGLEPFGVLGLIALIFAAVTLIVFLTELTSNIATTSVFLPVIAALAIGLGEDQTHSSIRIGCGRFNTDEEIEIAADEIYHAVESLEKIRI